MLFFCVSKLVIFFLWVARVLFFCLLLCHQTQRAHAGGVDVHVANITFRTVGWLATKDGLEKLNSVTRSVVCKPLGDHGLDSTKRPTTCGGRFVKLDGDYALLNMYAESALPMDSLLIGSVFRDWVDGNAGDLVSDLVAAASSVTKSSYAPPMKTGGVYTMPCRGGEGKKFLPLCTSTSNCRTNLLVTGMQESPQGVFCPLVPAPCSSYMSFNTTSVSGTIGVTIFNLSNTLELALKVVGSVRESRLSVTSIQLVSDDQTAELYTTYENVTYAKPIRAVLVCSSVDALWIVFIVTLLPFVFVILCSVWAKGRRSAKKKERKIIIEDEMRLQNITDFTGNQQGMKRATSNNCEYPQEFLENSNNYYYYYPFDEKQEENGEYYYEENANEFYEYPQEYTGQQEEDQEHEDCHQQAMCSGEEYEADEEDVGHEVKRDGNAAVTRANANDNGAWGVRK